MSDQDVGSDISAGLGAGGDDVVETTSKSWFGRIGDSLKAILFGLVLVVGSCILMFWNEGRTAETAAALREGAGLAVSVASDRIDPSDDGKLVHVAGETTSDQPVRDGDFGVAGKGLVLARKVEMYQWKEEKRSETQKKLGGGEETVTHYSYRKEWSEKPIDSSDFRNGAEHRNPAMPRLLSRDFYVRGAKLGAFGLDDNVLHELNAKDKFDAPDSALAQARAALGPRARVMQGGVYSGVDPDAPVVGDVRVGWTMLPLAPISVVARQTQGTFSPYVARNGHEVLMVEPGVVDAALMFKHGQDENRIIAWILRLVGVVLMFVGFRVMLSLLEVLADVIPFIGNIVGAGASAVALLCTVVLAPLVIAIAWMFYRPSVALAVLVIGGALAYGVHTMARNRAAARPAAGGPAPARPA